MLSSLGFARRVRFVASNYYFHFRHPLRLSTGFSSTVGGCIIQLPSPMETKDMPGPNSAGLAALEAHRHRSYFGRGRHKICAARCRRTGKPCRDIAMRGKRVCRKHGGHSNGRKKKSLADRTERQQQNFGIRQARALAAKDFKTRELHPETMTIFRQQFVSKVSLPNLSLFLLALDNRLKGNMDTRAWKEVLEGLAR